VGTLGLDSFQPTGILIFSQNTSTHRHAGVSLFHTCLGPGSSDDTPARGQSFRVWTLVRGSVLIDYDLPRANVVSQIKDNFQVRELE
jgi:hypothetical protein